MKVALNITREYLGGITATNISLLDHLHGSDDINFVGIELNPNRNFISPIVYRHLSPKWFNHRIISICDYRMGRIMKKVRSLKDLEEKFKPIIRDVRQILKKEKPDVVLIQGTYYVPWIISIAAKQEKIPIVLWYAGVLACETEKFSPRQRKIFLNMERSIVKRAKKIVFPSEVCRTTVRKRVLDDTKTKMGTVVPNPISPLFTNTKHLERSVDGQISFVGRDSDVKNLNAFCDLHLALKKMGWKHTATVVSSINPKRKKKIPSSIEVVPSMSAVELKTFYATQGLIVSPSHFETFGNVPIEAACLGIPVLVNSTMGCAEVLKNANLGNMVFDFKDIRGAAKRTIELCGQYILAKQINNLRKQVDAKYVAQKIVSVIRLCVKNAK